MRVKFRSRLLALAVIAAASVAAADQPADPKLYQNPILDIRFPDPTVIRVGDIYYAYGTGDVAGDTSGRLIPMSMTRDLKHWSAPKAVLIKPAWAQGAFWAPEVIRDPANPNRYVMYFSARAVPGANGVPPGSGLCLGVAVADRPEGPFTALDHPLDKDACAQGDGDIDPNVFVDTAPGGDGKRWLYWGSHHLPIRRQQIAADLLSLVPGTKDADVLRPTPQGPPVEYTDLVEGSWVLYRQGHYFLLTSGWQCCSKNDDSYAVVAWRADSAKGPWTRFPGGDHGAILHSNATWGSPGHNSIFTDGAGHDWILYHARHRGKPGKRVLLMDRLEWVDGWPKVVTDAAPGTPSTGPMPAPVPPRG